MPHQKIVPDDTDHAYFTVTPNLLWALCRNPYDLACWMTVKLVAGDASACILSAEEAAALAGMSVGKWVDCRTHLLDVGALTGELVRDPGYPQPVWHLRIPDLWPANIRWRETTGDSLRTRLNAVQAARKDLHHMKALLQKHREPSPHEGSPSPGEGSPSPHEGSPSLGEAKKNHKEEPKEEPKEEEENCEIFPAAWRDAIQALRSNPELHSAVTAYLVPAKATLIGDLLTIHTVNHSGATTINDRLKPLIAKVMTRTLGRRIAVQVISPCGPLDPTAAQEEGKSAAEIWRLAQSSLRRQLPNPTYEHYVRDMTLHRRDEDLFDLRSSTPEQVEFVRIRLAPKITAALSAIVGHPAQFSVSTPNSQ